MTDISTVFPEVKPVEAAPTDPEVLAQNTERSSFDAAVQAEVAKQLAAHLANTEQRTFDVPDGPEMIARDAVTGVHYGGLVSRELADACKTARNGEVIAVSRSIVKDRFGSKENVWFPAPEPDGLSPIPGEHRRVWLEEQPDKGTVKPDGSSWN